MSVVRVMMAMRSTRKRGRRHYLRPLKTIGHLSRSSAKCIQQSIVTLIEKLITITGVDPVEVLGANDANLRIIRALFPKLNIIARGDTLKVSGAETDIVPLRGALQAAGGACGTLQRAAAQGARRHHGHRRAPASG